MDTDIYKRPSMSMGEERLFLLKNNPELAFEMMRAEAQKQAVVASAQHAVHQVSQQISSGGRSRKSRDPKRLRQNSPLQVVDDDEDDDDELTGGTSISDSSQTANEVMDSSRAQTEPEDLSQKTLKIRSNLELMMPGGTFESGEEKMSSEHRLSTGSEDDDKENSSDSPTANTTSSPVSPAVTSTTLAGQGATSS